MKVFVTGGTGYIGAHVVLELLREGHEVTVLSREPRGLDGVSWVRGGLEDIGDWGSSLAGHDAVVHCAILWGPFPSEMELPDIRASLALFRAASEAGVVHFIYTSSTAVNFPLEGYKREDDRVAPTDMYGATKAATEILLHAASFLGTMRLTVLRVGPTVGPPAMEGARANGHSRFVQLVRAALRSEKLSVIDSDGRQFIGVRDLARAYVAALTAPGNREVYTVVSRDFVQWREIAFEIVDLVGSGEVEVRDAAMEPHGFDVEKLRTGLGLEFEIRPAIREHLEYLIASERMTAFLDGPAV